MRPTRQKLHLKKYNVKEKTKMYLVKKIKIYYKRNIFQSTEKYSNKFG